MSIVFIIEDQGSIEWLKPVNDPNYQSTDPHSSHSSIIEVDRHETVDHLMDWIASRGKSHLMYRTLSKGRDWRDSRHPLSDPINITRQEISDPTVRSFAASLDRLMRHHTLPIEEEIQCFDEDAEYERRRDEQA